MSEATDRTEQRAAIYREGAALTLAAIVHALKTNNQENNR